MFLKEVRRAWRSPDRRCSMVSRDFACQLEGYGLTTASILYRMPDHRSILQEFIWQEYDLAPRSTACGSPTRPCSGPLTCAPSTANSGSTDWARPVASRSLSMAGLDMA